MLTPRFSPDQRTIVYMTYSGRAARVIFVYDIGTGQAAACWSTQPYMTFAPRFSPDGRRILFSMAIDGNTDIYRIPAGGGTPQRLTNAPGHRHRRQLFARRPQDRVRERPLGSQQLYVMNADGSNQHRISFGGGRYATPVWSPRGDLIAFTRIAAASGSG